MGSSKDVLIDRIHELEEQVKDLKESKKHIYVHESTTLWVSHGELHMDCDQGTVVFNMQSLFNDLPTIIGLCIEEYNNNKKTVINQIKKHYEL